MQDATPLIANMTEGSRMYCAAAAVIPSLQLQMRAGTCQHKRCRRASPQSPSEASPHPQGLRQVTAASGNQPLAAVHLMLHVILIAPGKHAYSKYVEMTSLLRRFTGAARTRTLWDHVKLCMTQEMSYMPALAA